MGNESHTANFLFCGYNSVWLCFSRLQTFGGTPVVCAGAFPLPCSLEVFTHRRTPLRLRPRYKRCTLFSGVQEPPLAAMLHSSGGGMCLPLSPLSFFAKDYSSLLELDAEKALFSFFGGITRPLSVESHALLILGGENVSEMFLHFPMNSGWARPRRESFIVFIHLVRSSSFSRGLKIVHLRLFFRLLSAVCRVLGRLLMDFSGKSRARMNHSVFLFVLMTLSDVRAKTMKK